jgi:hypothetical protein
MARRLTGPAASWLAGRAAGERPVMRVEAAVVFGAGVRFLLRGNAFPVTAAPAGPQNSF